MPSDEIRPNHSSDQATTHKLSFSEAECAVIEAAARREGCSPDEALKRAVRRALEGFQVDILHNFTRRLSTVRCGTDQLLADLKAAGRGPTDAEISGILRDLKAIAEEMAVYDPQLAELLCRPAGQGSVPTPPSDEKQ